MTGQAQVAGVVRKEQQVVGAAAVVHIMAGSTLKLVVKKHLVIDSAAQFGNGCVERIKKLTIGC